MDVVTMQSDVFNFIFANQGKMKEAVKFLTEQRDNLLQREDRVFHDDIKLQYIDLARKVIMIEIAKGVTVPADIILEIVEALDVEKYLA
jgi:hypothetical protein